MKTASAPESLFDDARAESALAGFRLDQPVKESILTLLPSERQATNARFFTGLGLHEFEQDHFGRARDYFLIASQIGPLNHVHVENLVDTYVCEERFQEALDVIDEHSDRLWIKGRLPVIHAALQARVGNGAAAITEYRQIFEDGHWDEVAFINFIETIWKHESPQAALDEVSAGDLGSRKESPTLIVLRSDLHMELERPDEAIELLQRGLKKHENDSQLLIALIAAYRNAGRLEESLSLAEKAAAGPVANAGIWLQKGITEFELKRHAEAKTSLETANRQAPGVPLIEELLATVTAALGQGDTQLVSNAIDAVPLPGAAELTMFAVDDPGRDPEAHTYRPWRIEAISFELDTEFRRTVYLSYSPRDESAVEGLRTLSFTFNPLCEELFLNRLDVFDVDGAPVASVDRHSAYLTHERSGVQASDQVTLNVPVPALRPGRRIEAVVTTRDRRPPEKFPYHSHLFSSSDPIGYDIVSVCGDVDHVTWVGLDPVSKSNDELIWFRRHTPGVPYEPHQASPYRFLPVIELTDASRRWDSEVREYLDAIKDRLATPAVTRKLAKQITDAREPQDLVAALAEYVQSRFTYQALEFGRHTRIMNSSETVIANQYGDCKDLSLLLWQLLREHGINAHLALVHSSGELTSNLETIDQCDHMVVYLPDISGGHVLDATNRWGNPRLPVPSNLSGSDAVILEASNPRVVRLPECPDDQFQQSVSVTVHFGADGTAQIEQALQFLGYSANAFRALLGRYSPHEQKNVVRQSMTINDRNVQVETVEIENLHDLQAPFVIRLSGKSRKALYDADGHFIGEIPLLSDIHMFEADDEPVRRTPFAFKHPLTTHINIAVVPPEGWSVRTRTGDSRNGENDFLRWSAEERFKNSELVINASYQRRAGCFPPTRREDYRKAVQHLSALLSPSITLERTNAETSTAAEQLDRRVR